MKVKITELGPDEEFRFKVTADSSVGHGNTMEEAAGALMFARPELFGVELDTTEIMPMFSDYLDDVPDRLMH